MSLTDFQTEQNLVDSLRRNSSAAFESLFDRYSQKLYHFALSYIKSESESEEIVQEVFLKIWENRATLKSDKSFKAYLFTIAFNAIKKHFNKKIREDKYKHELINWLGQEHPNVESKIAFEELITKLDFLIAQFPEKRKTIFLMRKKEGKSIEAIATELNISPKTVKNQITEGMKSLKKSFENDNLSALLFYVLFIS